MRGNRQARSSWSAWLLVLLCCGPSQPERLASFDGERAFRDLVDQVAIGPRPAGSPEAERTRELIRSRLRQAGWAVQEHGFRAAPPGGEAVEMVNLIGVRTGQRERELILLVAHYDTKRLEGMRFVGANDGASGVALLLEFARQLGARTLPFTVWLVFFDGEEAFGPDINARDGLYGSRALAARMQADGSLESIRALILVDMVADRDLNLAVDLASSAGLRRLQGEAARKLGLAELIDPRATLKLVDDHTPFAERGVEEVLAFIDFQFGARRTPGPYWHTARDDLSAVSVESLNSVGRLVVQTFNEIERQLLRSEREASR